MSSRVTRSSARLAAESAQSTASQPSVTNARPQARKRKAAAAQDQTTEEPPEPVPASPPRKTKRRKTTTETPSRAAPANRRKRGNNTTAMSSSSTPAGPSNDSAKPSAAASNSSRRKSNRSRKNAQDDSTSTASGSRRTRRSGSKRDNDVTMRDEEHAIQPPSDDDDPAEEDLSDEEDEDQIARDYTEEDDDEDGDEDDPFGSGYLGGAGAALGLSSTLRALTGMMSGTSARFRDILNNLREKDDPSVQLIALQELSEIFLVSTEDNLSGHFSPDQFVKELVALMQPNDFGEENPEIMLLACRCIANLMEALPSSTANVVYCGAVPVLCQKLLEINFIDLAEQALSTLEKISVEFPGSIVREGGLTACLTYLDFFATSTQRTAVTTAANCCRNIPEDSFPVIRDVMPILLNVLSSSDQKVVEQGCLCVSRVVESFRNSHDKLEELISTDLLRAVLRLLLPGATNLIGPNIHTQFLRVLAITARASPALSAELFKMNIVDTIYQILTGVSPPNGTEDVASKIDSVVIMQALIHRPREQVFETLNVICELLPGLQQDSLSFPVDQDEDRYLGVQIIAASRSSRSRKQSPNEKRIHLLQSCKSELRRFATILLPTLTDAYSSTVNLNVRQKVLTAQLKMLSNFESDILKESLRNVPYASFLASILSQKDHLTLVTFALQAAEILLKRLEPIYRYQFYREGVIAEISKLAASTPAKEDDKSVTIKSENRNPASRPAEPVSTPSLKHHTEEDHGLSDDDIEDDEHDDLNEDMSLSPSSPSSSDDDFPISSDSSSTEDLIRFRARKFLEAHEDHTSTDMRGKATNILNDLQSLAQDIKQRYLGKSASNGLELFHRLAHYFDGDALESITSSELLSSDIVQVLLEVFSNPDEQASNEARATFLEVFMNSAKRTKMRTSSTSSPATPFSILVHKLQILLSRAEHFEVITVHQNSFDSNKSSAASMLAKQIRLKLVADDESEVPRPYRNIMVSIHAIATFKALDDYLRPRISLPERSRMLRNRDGVSGALAAFAAAAGLTNPGDRMGADTNRSDPSLSGSAAPPRSSRKSSKMKTKGASGQMTSEQQEKLSGPRRSSRKQKDQTSSPAVPRPPPDSDDVRDPLECADETQLTDEENELDESSALDAIVDDFGEDLGDDDDEPSDPSAINMELGSTGKVTARKEDGARVATPSRTSGTSSTTAPSLPNQAQTPRTPNLTPTARPMSYAAAIQATPQDWHIEFTIDGQSISNETTIYRAVHFNKPQSDESSARTVWSAVHPVRFRRVPGPPPPEPSSLTPPPESVSPPQASGLPLSLDKNPITSSILRLLNILHALNANLDDVLAENKKALSLNAEPLAQFVNTKLTAKLNRQLEEPLIVASNCLPSWSEDLARLYPFLFPFETRHLFLQSTSFGYSRSMTRWQNVQSNDSRQDRHRDERPFLGRLQRQKVRISRTRILESAIKVMELYGASPSILEVEYFEEVGTGLGPTLEFYSTVSKEFSKKKLKLWRENESASRDEYAFGKKGLFPAPMSEKQADSENGRRVLHLFKMLGKFVARSMLDSRIIDVSFNPTFFRVGDGPVTVVPSLGAVKTVDDDLAKSLKLFKQFMTEKRKIDEDQTFDPGQKARAVANVRVHGARVEDLELDFTLPGYPSIELIPNGSNVPVTIENVGQYVERVIDLTLGSGVQKQVKAFTTGFSQVFPYSALSAFTPGELVMLFGRVEEDWSLETLTDSIKADHGYNMDSKSVRNLLQAMSEMSIPERRDFLQFVTGSPKLPIGGFKSLTPMFTVVCKPSEPPYTSDDYLPSVMTCVNYLKLPDYTTLDTLRQKLNVAVKEGQGAFHLS
ncbi:hypothetical protein L228DRAFT_248745 [Xylona heveae TC161]|uniref:HECT-type E3 ubiquitin transferase n=1 Tax=Xylona heveae (strain CBS 132557 / TC161) TaxID=1328760 RepID=A0A165FHV9_XYLHT|nr:hypothetical protein L228DRAFT_248745 [Xylona heveae TC161]KZF20998.1 hypothetical protein L228DRAFT_248745 [Xylona heveae TC161]